MNIYRHVSFCGSSCHAISSTDRLHNVIYLRRMLDATLDVANTDSEMPV